MCTTKELEFKCRHCGEIFTITVEIGDKENSSLVETTVYCGNCGKACTVEMSEHEVRTSNLYRGGS